MLTIPQVTYIVPVRRQKTVRKSSERSYNNSTFCFWFGLDNFDRQILIDVVGPKTALCNLIIFPVQIFQFFVLEKNRYSLQYLKSPWRQCGIWVKNLRLQPLHIACKFHFWPPKPGLMTLALQNTALWLLLCNFVTMPGMLAEWGFNWLRTSHDYRLRISIDWSDRRIKKKYIHQFHQLHTYMFIPFIWEFSYRNIFFLLSLSDQWT